MRHVWARPGIISVPITRHLDAWVDQRRAVFRSSRDGTAALEDFLAHQEPAPALALMLQRWAVAFFTTHMEAFGSGVENIVPLLFSFFSVLFFSNASPLCMRWTLWTANGLASAVLWFGDCNVLRTISWDLVQAQLL